MTIFTPVQPTLNSSPTKLGLDGMIGVVNRDIVLVDTRCFRSLGLLLFNVVQPIPSAEAFQLVSKGKDWDLNKVLIVAFTHVGASFQRWVVTHNNRPNLSTDTEIVRLITKILSFGKEVLTYRVQSNVKQIFGQVAQVCQYLVFGVIQFQSNCLSQQHCINPLDKSYCSGNNKLYKHNWRLDFPLTANQKRV